MLILHNYCKFLVENLPEFQCFLSSFKFLRKEFNTYYTLLKQDYNAVVDVIINDGTNICQWLFFNTYKSLAEKKLKFDFNSYKKYFHLLFSYINTSVYKDEKPWSVLTKLEEEENGS